MFGKRPRLNAQRERCDSTGMTAGASVAPFWKGKLGVAAGPTRVVPMATSAIATSEPMTGQMAAAQRRESRIAWLRDRVASLDSINESIRASGRPVSHAKKQNKLPRTGRHKNCGADAPACPQRMGSGSADVTPRLLASNNAGFRATLDHEQIVEGRWVAASNEEKGRKSRAVEIGQIVS